MATPQTPSPEESAQWAHAGMLSALAIVLGYLETFVPIPIPGVKLGLANVAILIALARGERREAVTVALIKVLAAGLLFGNPLTMAYSAAGTALSLLVMLPLSHLETLHLAMLSVAGALAHEAGQLLVAQALLGTSLVWYSAPPLMVAGLVTGALCGAVATRTVSLMGDGPGPAPAATTGPAEASPTTADKLALVAYVAFVVIALRATSAPLLATLLALAALSCLALRMPVGSVARSLRPILPIVLVTLVAQVASNQAGTMLAQVGPIALTREALVRSAVMVARLLAIGCASIAVSSAIPRERGLGLARWLLSPLEALGLRSEGPVLALDVAMSLVPTLAGDIERQMATHGLRLSSPALWRDVIPEVVARLYAGVGTEAPSP